MATDKKREAIIDAAYKRFAHFGVPKTTMNEISDDLGISKASLYYYFPDKLSLYVEVLSRIFEEADKNKQPLKENPFASIKSYLDARVEYILRNQNLLEYLNSLIQNPDKQIADLIQKAHLLEFNRLKEIIDQGVEQGIFKISDSAAMADILLTALSGLRYYYTRNKPNYMITKEFMEGLLHKEQILAQTFLKGLTV